VSTTVAALPTIFPVHYALLDGDIVFRALAGTKLASTVEGAVIAFGADDIGLRSTTGWSIVVVGPAHSINTCDQTSAERLLVNRWQPGGAAKDVFRMSTAVMNGRTFDTTTT
jgi:hypothetical protein